MRIHVSLDSALSRFTNKSEFEIDALTIRGAIQAIDKENPRFSSHVTSADGTLLPFIEVYLDDTQISEQNLDTRLQDGSWISFMMASMGG